jgi:hypothetical protein
MALRLFFSLILCSLLFLTPEKTSQFLQVKCRSRAKSLRLFLKAEKRLAPAFFPAKKRGRDRSVFYRRKPEQSQAGVNNRSRNIRCFPRETAEPPRAQHCGVSPALFFPQESANISSALLRFVRVLNFTLHLCPSLIIFISQSNTCIINYSVFSHFDMPSSSSQFRTGPLRLERRLPTRQGQEAGCRK